jgi:hypothetical protein
MCVAAVWLTAAAVQARKLVRFGSKVKQCHDGLAINNRGGRENGRMWVVLALRQRVEKLQRLKCWTGRMRIVDGCAGFVSKPMGSRGDASTGGNGRACYCSEGAAAILEYGIDGLAWWDEGFYLMVVVVCDARDCVWSLEGRTQRRAPLQALFQTQKWWINSNEKQQENGICKQKYLSLIWK